ncbi:MAG: hypothetical protein HYZ26_04650 [Chloroflexi bacterium]|nr:hypothetical protein [Chloroflexota bacterium]
MKALRILMVTGLLFLPGCAGVFKALGYVPQADLDSANIKIQTLQQSVDAANQEISSLKTQLTATQREATQARNDLADEREKAGQLETELEVWQAIRCPGHTWQEAWTVQAIFPFKGVLNDFPTSGLYVTFTQWKTQSGWVSGAYSTTLLWDMDGEKSFIIDTEEDCIIINPDFSELGR